MTAGAVEALGAVLGVAIPAERAAAIGRELAALAGRIGQGAVRAAVDDAPADAVKALR